MSEVYNKYKKLKEKNKEEMYLFKIGKFYIFLDEDANRINDYVVLKKTPFCKDVLKCGFPVERLEDYLKVFHNHKLSITIVEPEENKEEQILDYLKKIDLDKLSPIKALNILYEMKESLV